MTEVSNNALINSIGQSQYSFIAKNICLKRYFLKKLAATKIMKFLVIHVFKWSLYHKVDLKTKA